MIRLEHILWLISEECNEVGQRASKAARFGLSETEPDHELDNLKRIWVELNDLFGAIELLVDETGYDGTDLVAIEKKKAKFEKFLKYSESCGTYSKT